MARKNEGSRCAEAFATPARRFVGQPYGAAIDQHVNETPRGRVGPIHGHGERAGRRIMLSVKRGQLAKLRLLRPLHELREAPKARGDDIRGCKRRCREDRR
jgi:hypothetical protein